jgi:RNA polymerase sigma-B factor
VVGPGAAAPQELRYEVRAAVDLLSERLGRSPTTPEVAEYLYVTVDEVIDCLCADSNFRAESLDGMVNPDACSADTRSGEGYEHVDSTDAFETAVARLPARLQQVVRLRFDEQLRQRDIATRIGVSQVHVSRLLRQAIEQLRPVLTGGGAAPTDAFDRDGALAVDGALRVAG